MLDNLPVTADLAGRPEALDQVTTTDIKQFLRNYARTIILSLLIGLAGALLYVFTATPLYTAQVQLLIDSRYQISLPERASEAISALDTPQVESQIAVLRSDRLAANVVQKLGLANDPEFAQQTGQASSQPAPGSTGTADGTGRAALVSVKNQLEVRRYGLSYVIDIFFSSRSPDKAALIANAFADAFIADTLAMRGQAARQGSDWLQERIHQLRRQMNEAALRVQEFKVKRDYRIQSKREPGTPGDAPAAKSTDMNGPEVNTLEELETTAQAYRRIYESYLQAFTESVQRQSYPIANAQVIAPALKPLSKSHPKSVLALLLGALGAGFVGLGLALLRHSLDRSVRTPQQVRDTIGIDCLAQLPRIGDNPSGPLPDQLLAFAKQVVGLDERLDPERVWRQVVEAPASPFTSALRGLSSAISRARSGSDIRIVGITSALYGEGKSSLACNFAALSAASYTRRILVIDADIGRATLSHAMVGPAKRGLTQALREGVVLNDLILFNASMGFYVLPVGSSDTTSAATNSGLGSERMRELLRECGKEFDLVIVDLPPLELEREALSLVPSLEGIIIAVESGKTPLPALFETANAIRKAQGVLLGVVLTKVEGQPDVGRREQDRQWLPAGAKG